MWQLFWFVVFTVVGEILAPRPPDAPGAGLGDFTFPTAEAGRPIPIIAGTIKLAGANTVWYGDLRVRPVEQSTGLFGLGGSQTIANRYNLGFHMALCLGPIDELVAVEFGDKPAEYSEATVGDKLQLTFALERLFGGEKREGGIAGVMDFYLGSATQTENDYLLTALGEAALPGYRSVVQAISRQMYLGTSNYIKAPAFIVRHFPNSLGLSAGRHIVNGRNANVACLVYWLLTDVNVGVQFPPTQIDTATFLAVGATTFTEGLGVNFQFDSPVVAGDAIDEILRHVDGFHYIDPETGLFGIGLVRDDYVVEDLPVFDGSNIVSVEIEEPSWAEQVNYVTVEYMDTDFKKQAVPYPNLAGIERRGEVDARTYRYHGFDTDTAALQVAARVAKRHAYPLKGGSMIVNREGWALHEGSVFYWSGYPMDIGGRVMRIIDVDNGDIESGEIRWRVVEDIFSVDNIAYEAPSSGWTDPVVAVTAAAHRRVIEVPYHFLGVEATVLWLIAVRSAQSDLGYDGWQDPPGGEFQLVADDAAFVPSGTLVSSYNTGWSEDGTGFTVEGGTDLEDLSNADGQDYDAGLQLALIDDELFAWQNVTNNFDGTFTFAPVIRAVHDTCPRPHAAGARVYFLTEAQVFGAAIVTDGATNVRFLPFNGRSQLSLADAAASQVAITTGSRHARPYPPGRFRINGQFAPTQITGDLSITWADRNRDEQYAAGVVVTQADSTSYTRVGECELEFWIDGALRRTENVNGEAFTYTEAMRISDYGADLNAPVSIFARQVAGSVESEQSQAIENLDMVVPS